MASSQGGNCKKRTTEAKKRARASNLASQSKKARVRKERYERFCKRQAEKHAKKREKGIKMGVHEVSAVIGRKKVSLRHDQYIDDIDRERIAVTRIPWSTPKTDILKTLYSDNPFCAKISCKFSGIWILKYDSPSLVRVLPVKTSK